jgi:hypothetical protein
MGKLLILIAAMALTASCNNGPANCECIAVGACTGVADTSTLDTCGVGLVCCPTDSDGGPQY